jgi:ABC-2 type transport system ATP-binding protein
VTAVSASADGRRADVGVYSVAHEVGADVREEIAAAVVNAGYGLLELRQAGMSLEDIFLKLTTDENEPALEGAAA